MLPPHNSQLMGFALNAALSTLFGVWAFYSDRPWLKLGLGILAGIFLLVAGLILYNWLGQALSYQAHQARERESLTPAVVFAQAVRYLTPAQLALVDRYQTIEAQGILSNKGVVWVYRGLKGKDIPVDWAANYLELSQDTSPNLYPVRGREGDRFWGWDDTELARAFTDLLVAHGYAIPAAGRASAVLKIGLGELAEILDIRA